jgi:hypothetical protein
VRSGGRGRRRHRESGPAGNTTRPAHGRKGEPAGFSISVAVSDAIPGRCDSDRQRVAESWVAKRMEETKAVSGVPPHPELRSGGWSTDSRTMAG